MADNVSPEEHDLTQTDARRALALLASQREPLNTLWLGLGIFVLVLLLAIVVEIGTAMLIVDVAIPTVSGPANAANQLTANIFTVGIGCGIIFAHFLLERLTKSIPQLVDYLVLGLGLAATAYFVYRGTGFSSHVLADSMSVGGAGDTRSFRNSLGGLTDIFDTILPLALSITHLMARRIVEQFAKINAQYDLRLKYKRLSGKLDRYLALHGGYQAKLLLHDTDTVCAIDQVAGTIAAEIASVRAAHADWLRSDVRDLPPAVRAVPLAERQSMVEMLKRYSPQHVKQQLIEQGAS